MTFHPAEAGFKIAHDANKKVSDEGSAWKSRPAKGGIDAGGGRLGSEHLGAKVQKGLDGLSARSP